MKRSAEALVLLQRGQLHSREASNLTSTSDTVLSSTFPLTPEVVGKLSKIIDEGELVFKRDWFTYNGGATQPEKDTTKKPLFFDIALNYVQLDMDRLQERAGLAVNAQKSVPIMAEPRPAQVNKAKMEEIERPATPEIDPARGGLSSLLGGWWGRK